MKKIILVVTAFFLIIKLFAGNIEKTFTFSDINENPTKLIINRTKDSLFYLNNGIFKASVDLQVLPTQPIVESKNRILYGMTIHQESSTIYVSNCFA